MVRVVLSVCVALLGGSEAWALVDGGGGTSTRFRPAHFALDACQKIAEEAGRRGLPASFLGRLIWKESLFDPEAVSHKGAEGIAQFMPQTALERGLEDAFDPATAIAASAHYLADLRGQFGNLGLAAAGYNAGPSRVESWLAGNATLPLETQEYVRFVTGHAAEDWVEKDTLQTLPITDRLPFHIACPKLVTRQIAARMPDPAAGGGGRQAPSTPWGVQIAAHFSQDVALAQFSRIRAKYQSILTGPSITVATKSRSRGRRALHSIRVGVESRDAAEAMCNRLRSAGGACTVIKN